MNRLRRPLITLVKNLLQIWRLRPGHHHRFQEPLLDPVPTTQSSAAKQEAGSAREEVNRTTHAVSRHPPALVLRRRRLVHRRRLIQVGSYHGFLPKWTMQHGAMGQDAASARSSMNQTAHTVPLRPPALVLGRRRLVLQRRLLRPTHLAGVGRQRPRMRPEAEAHVKGEGTRAEPLSIL